MINKFSYPHPLVSEATIEKVASLLRTGNLSMYRASKEGHLGGKHVQELEQVFCDYFNVKHAIAMNSATACLHAACLACHVEEDDEVIVSPYTFSSSASCVLMANATPIFADIDYETFNITPNTIKFAGAVKHAVRAIIPVHLCGHPADMDGIMATAKEMSVNQRIYVIEDAAQAIGAKYHGRYAGTIGDCGIFSFNQSKQISSGEGGILVTNNDEIAEACREIRNHGEVSVGGRLGWNYRMCEVEAIIALDQFKNLDENIAYRIELTSRMTERLDQIEGIIPPSTKPDCVHTFYTYFAKYDKDFFNISRDEFQDKLIEQGLYFGKGYVKPLYLLPIYQKGEFLSNYRRQARFPYRKGCCPVSEEMWLNQAMVTDIFKPPMLLSDVDKIGDIIEETADRCRKKQALTV